MGGLHILDEYKFTYNLKHFSHHPTLLLIKRKKWRERERKIDREIDRLREREIGRERDWERERVRDKNRRTDGQARVVCSTP